MAQSKFDALVLTTTATISCPKTLPSMSVWPRCFDDMKVNKISSNIVGQHCCPVWPSLNGKEALPLLIKAVALQSLKAEGYSFENYKQVFFTEVERLLEGLTVFRSL